jgi:DNA-binding response OmpR family regulator
MLPSRLQVLCADDNEDICLMLSILLGRHGIDVRTADTATEALWLARERRFDLLMLDSKFQDGDGFELCRHIREFDLDTPILFYSGSAHETDKAKGLAAGAQGYIVKPELSRLVEAVRSLASPRAHTALNPCLGSVELPATKK